VKTGVIFVNTRHARGNTNHPAGRRAGDSTGSIPKAPLRPGRGQADAKERVRGLEN